MVREVGGGARGCGHLGPVLEQREQRKSSEIKTNAVCGNTKTWSPCPGQREPPSSSSGAWLRGRGALPWADFLLGCPPRLARVSILRLAAHARVCVCVCFHTPRRMLKPAPKSPLVREAPRPAGRPISAPPGRSAVPSPGCGRRIGAGRTRLRNHPCPSSVLAPPRAAPFPPAGNVAGNSEWRSPPPSLRPSRRQLAVGAGRQLGNQSGLPGDPGGPSRRLHAASPPRSSRAIASPRRAPTEATCTPGPPARPWHRRSPCQPPSGSPSKLEEGRSPPARASRVLPPCTRAAPSTPLPPRAPSLASPS